MGLDGPSKTVIYDPVEEPQREEPIVEPEREKVPEVEPDLVPV